MSLGAPSPMPSPGGGLDLVRGRRDPEGGGWLLSACVVLFSAVVLALIARSSGQPYATVAGALGTTASLALFLIARFRGGQQSQALVVVGLVASLVPLLLGMTGS